MTFVVGRPKGRWEVRESVLTDAGPRARSLATFRILDLGVLRRAEAAATTPFDRAQVVAAARRAGAPVAESGIDAAARALLAELAAGATPNPGLTRLLRDRLVHVPAAELASGDSVADWVNASAADRGTALRDLLGLADRLPEPHRSRLQFPGLRAAAPRG